MADHAAKPPRKPAAVAGDGRRDAAPAARAAKSARKSRAAAAGDDRGGGRAASLRKIPRNQDTPLGKLATEELRLAILTGRYKPGDRLVESHLSAELGISRVPIREALRTLAGDGLVEVRPNRGAVVAFISPDTANDLIEVRALLEGLNARLAARHQQPEIVARLSEVLRQGNAAAVSRKVKNLVGLNAQFHDLLAQAGRNAILLDIMRMLRERTGLVFARNSASRAVVDWEEHSRILAAVIDGDEEMAALLATRHVHRAGQAAVEAIGRGAADIAPEP